MMSTRTTLKSGQTVFDPRGTVTAAALTLAPRVETLQGTRLGVLDNSKWNASKLLRRTVALLESETAPSAINRYTKDSFSRVKVSMSRADSEAVSAPVSILALKVSPISGNWMYS